MTSIDDILDELGIEKMPLLASKTKDTLASNNKNLVKCIGFETTSIDEIIQRSGLSIEKVTCELAELELEGCVTAVPGGYTRCPEVYS